MISEPDRIIEQVVTMPILNPKTGRSSRSFTFMGKVDVVDPARRCVRDWKGVDDPQRFIRMLRIGYQAELYVLALMRLGISILEIEYCLITRPTIRLCQKYDGMDPERYLQRCVEWLLEKPEHLVRHSYIITPQKLEQAAWFLWEASKRILECRRWNRWIPNTMACYAYEKECPYADLCEAVQNGNDWDFVAEEWYEVIPSSHPELNCADLHPDCGDVLTHTSLSDLTRCEMYYQWKHEQRMRKRREDHGEALWIGSAMHAGMEAYATGGEDAAAIAIDAWADDNPVLGEDDTRKQDQQIARARAMIRAAAMRWETATDGDTPAT